MPEFERDAGRPIIGLMLRADDTIFDLTEAIVGMLTHQGAIRTDPHLLTHLLDGEVFTGFVEDTVNLNNTLILAWTAPAGLDSRILAYYVSTNTGPVRLELIEDCTITDGTPVVFLDRNRQTRNTPTISGPVKDPTLGGGTILDCFLFGGDRNTGGGVEALAETVLQRGTRYAIRLTAIGGNATIGLQLAVSEEA